VRKDKPDHLFRDFARLLHNSLNTDTFEGNGGYIGDAFVQRDRHSDQAEIEAEAQEKQRDLDLIIPNK
jgi:hypothetical protein